MNTIKKLTCVVCPAGCPIEAELDENGAILTVQGNSCPRGKAYAVSELTHPVRTLTTTVALAGAAETRLPVRTDKPIPKETLFEAMRLASTLCVQAPVARGDVVFSDFVEPGTNLIACKTVEKAELHPF